MGGLFPNYWNGKKYYSLTILKANYNPGEKGLGSTWNSEDRTRDGWFLRKAISLHLVSLA